MDRPDAEHFFFSRYPSCRRNNACTSPWKQQQQKSQHTVNTHKSIVIQWTILMTKHFSFFVLSFVKAFLSYLYVNQCPPPPHPPPRHQPYLPSSLLILLLPTGCPLIQEYSTNLLLCSVTASAWLFLATWLNCLCVSLIHCDSYGVCVCVCVILHVCFCLPTQSCVRYKLSFLPSFQPPTLDQ